jgi:hypothetical protein
VTCPQDLVVPLSTYTMPFRATRLRTKPQILQEVTAQPPASGEYGDCQSRAMLPTRYIAAESGDLVTVLTACEPLTPNGWKRDSPLQRPVPAGHCSGMGLLAVPLSAAPCQVPTGRVPGGVLRHASSCVWNPILLSVQTNLPHSTAPFLSSFLVSINSVLIKHDITCTSSVNSIMGTQIQ